MIILRHKLTQYWQFIAKLSAYELEYIIIDQAGDTVKSDIIKMNLASWLQMQKEGGWVLEWRGLDEAMKKRNKIVKHYYY